jgi:maltose alpha-D-glucosyltransferase/alpha-amylase
MRTRKNEVFYELRRRQTTFPGETLTLCGQVLDSEADILARYRALVDRRVQSSRIRCHGNLHLAHLLFTGKDFVFVDFEGQGTTALSERKSKRSPMLDVSSMLQSFYYAVSSTLYGLSFGVAPAQAVIREEDIAKLEPWAEFWFDWIAHEFMRGYCDRAGNAPFVPQSPEEHRILLDAYLIDANMRALAFELQRRPTWMRIPLQGILDVLVSRGDSPADAAKEAGSVLLNAGAIS